MATYRDTHATRAAVKLQRAQLGEPQLPPELWLRICELVVVVNDPLEVNLHFHYSSPNAWFDAQCTKRDMSNMSRSLQPALSRVSTLLRKETLRLFYAGNFFYANRFEEDKQFGAEAWLRSIGERNRKALNRFTVITILDEGEMRTWAEDVDPHVVVTRSTTAEVVEIANAMIDETYRRMHNVWELRFAR